MRRTLVPFAILALGFAILSCNPTALEPQQEKAQGPFPGPCILWPGHEHPSTPPGHGNGTEPGVWTDYYMRPPVEWIRANKDEFALTPEQEAEIEAMEKEFQAIELRLRTIHQQGLGRLHTMLSAEQCDSIHQRIHEQEARETRRW